MAAPTTINPATGTSAEYGENDVVTRDAKFTEDFDPETSYQEEPQAQDGPERRSTLKKNNSVSRKGSVRRSDSRKSTAGSVRSFRDRDEENVNSVFYTPIPTQSNPTEVLAERFSAWRKILKDFITYFREVQASYDSRAKSIHRITNILSNTTNPKEFVRSGGILETHGVLLDFHKEAWVNSESAVKIESDIIAGLISLRSDLNIKIKEIKALSGDFKNNLDKEKEATRREVLKYQEALVFFDSNVAGKTDPYLARLAVERQIKRQIDEENYVHRAFLNIENSGRQLESIVVQEIQNSFDTYVKIIKREGDELLDVAERLTTSTLRLPKDYEWSAFVESDPNMVDPHTPLRSIEEIEYPGYQHPAALEVRSGQMERKSKYLKSFTAGWYVLSPTHLHEFKSPDRRRDPAPVMSLSLPDSTLGKHSEPDSPSHKFILKARQTGPLHRGHSWVFRSGSHEDVLLWYYDIKKLTEVSGSERNEFVAGTMHRHTASSGSQKEGSCSSGLENDEADDVPYSAQASALGGNLEEPDLRPEGGRFPSDLQLNRAVDGAARASTSGDSAADAVPATRNRSGSQSSTWSYDEKHPVHSTLDDDDDEFLPVGAHISPAVERRMSVKHDYSQDHEVGERNRSPVSFRRGPPSRKPTASYGVDPITGELDPAVHGQTPGNQFSNADWTSILAGASGEPKHRSGSFSRRPPSRKPTASYGIDPITGQPDYGHAAGIGYSVPENRPGVTGRADSKQTVDTISGLHLPGEYPKQS